MTTDHSLGYHGDSWSRYCERPAVLFGQQVSSGRFFAFHFYLTKYITILIMKHEEHIMILCLIENRVSNITQHLTHFVCAIAETA